MTISLTRDRLGVPVQIGGVGDVISGDFGATATTMPSAVNSNVVRMLATAYVHFNFAGSSVTAATTDMLLAPDQPEIFSIPPGSTLNMIARGAGGGVLGTLYITEM